MAISLTIPSHCGPGYLVGLSGMTGPTPLDDTVLIGLRAPTSGNFVTAGLVQTLGATFVQVVLGVLFSGVLSDGLDEWIPPGTALDLYWNQSHSDLSVVDSGTVSGILWDPTGGAYQLMQIMLMRSGGGSELAEVLAAVRRTFP